MRFLRGKHGLRILDVGCGDGFIARALARQGHHVVGADVNLDSLREEEKMPMVRLDGSRLAFRHGCFDCILAFDVLEHIPELNQVIAEFDRVLSRSGQILLVYPWELVRGTAAIRDALQVYGRVWMARRLHLHRLYPGKIKKLVAGTRMRLARSKLFLSPSPAFATVLRRA